MPRRVTPSRALENLRREAKRWLKALRANAADARARLERALPGAPTMPTLRDVQHALAREHGFDGWAALKARLTADAAAPSHARPTLEDYERKAAHLLEAYRTGTREAMERHWADTWHRRSWTGMRSYVLADLGKRGGPEQENVDISLDDARQWVARDHGFESWRALADYLATVPNEKRRIAATPVRVVADGAPAAPDATTRDWDEAIEWLRERQLGALDANGQMTDDLLERVSRIEHVTTLRLGGSKALTDAGARHLARMARLRHLELGGSGVTDATLAVLGELPALESISLSWTAITDAGVAQLARCERLERVDLSGTSTGDRALAALSDKPRLRHVRSGNHVTDAGLPLLHRFPVFEAWRGGEVSLALLSPDAEPNSLGLRGSFTDRGMEQFAGLDGLFALDIDDARLPVTAAGLRPLVGLPNLGFLAFDAKDDAMPYIASMPRLRFLVCQDTTASDEGFVALSRSASLEYLWGRRCQNLRDRGFAALASIPSLVALSVSCRNVGEAGLSALPHFPALRELMPVEMTDDGYRHVGECERLESLVLMYCRDTTDAATERIRSLPRLRRYFASYTRITDRSLDILAEMPAIERIELSGCAGVTNAGVAALAKAPRLRELHLSGMQNVTRASLAALPPHIGARYSP